MDDGLYPVLRKHALQGGAIADIAFDEGGPFARDRLDAVEHRALAVAEVVEDQDFLPGAQQFDDGMRAYVSGTASDEDHFFWVSGVRP